MFKEPIWNKNTDVVETIIMPNINNIKLYVQYQ